MFKNLRKWLLMMALLCASWVTSAQITFPYTTGFEGLSTGQLPTGWLQLQSGSSGAGTFPAAYAYASNARNGSVYFEFESTTGQTELAALPVMDSINYLQLSFYASIMTHNFMLEVGVMEGTTFVPVDTIALTPGSGGNWHGSYYLYTVYFNNYTGTGDRMAMRTTSSGSYTLMIDDMTVDYIPTCPAPTNLTLDSASVDWMALHWSENGTATNWVVEYSTSPIATADLGQNLGTTVNVYGTPATTLTGLDTATVYYVYVYADCGTEYSNAVSLTASTLAGAAASIPFSCDFELDGPNGWELVNGTQTNYWGPFGVEYYRHAALCLFNAVSAISAVTGGVLDGVWREEKIRNMAEYVRAMHIPRSNHYFNFADCSPAAGRAGAREFLFGKKVASEGTGRRTYC